MHWSSPCLSSSWQGRAGTASHVQAKCVSTSPDVGSTRKSSIERVLLWLYPYQCDIVTSGHICIGGGGVEEAQAIVLRLRGTRPLHPVRQWSNETQCTVVRTVDDHPDNDQRRLRHRYRMERTTNGTDV